MTMTHSGSPRTLLVAFALLAGAAGCLPIPLTYTDSPSIVGQLARSDGTPLAGARIALSTAYEDSTCATPAAGTVTDSAGWFRLAATAHREPFIILLPIDRLRCYSVCGESEGALKQAYGTCLINERPPDRVLRCTEWPPEGTREGTRLSCFARRLDGDAQSDTL